MMSFRSIQGVPSKPMDRAWSSISYQDIPSVYSFEASIYLAVCICTERSSVGTRPLSTRHWESRLAFVKYRTSHGGFARPVCYRHGWNKVG